MIRAAFGMVLGVGLVALGMGSFAPGDRGTEQEVGDVGAGSRATSSPTLPGRPSVDKPAGSGDPRRARRALVELFGAVGDGVADDSDAIQKAVDSGAGQVVFGSGRFRITRPIVVAVDRVGPVSIFGGGTAQVVMEGAGPAFRIVGTHFGTAAPSTVQPPVWERQLSPTVDGLCIVGRHAEAVGIEAVGTMQLTVTRTTICDALHGIHLPKHNRNVVISDCHVYRNRGVGIYLDDVNLHQMNVVGCHVSYNGGGGIVSRAGNMRNLHIAGCDIEGNMAADGPPTANVLIDSTGGAHGTAEVAITGCTIQHTHTAAGSANIRFLGADREGRYMGNLTISGNVLSDAQINIDVRHSRGVAIVGNTLWKGYAHDIRLEDCEQVAIGANALDNNPRYHYGDGPTARHGVVLSNCRDCTIAGLHVFNVRGKQAGIVLADCRRINVTGCSVLDCDNAGMLLSNVTNSRVSNCLISHQSQGTPDWEPIRQEGGTGNVVQQ